MPIYDYECESCGPFREMRPMAESAAPCACPVCATPSPRAFLSMPHLFTMDAGRRTALATNERASNEPISSKSERARRLHPANCSCCKPGAKQRATVFRADGAKSFPTARPWMISH
ncbi:MAG: zinc ribbon domain-containing protein [Hyphomicrobiales bacterium]|nr:zinc ribbon domain-containing protein [Hyphomicrobiales bacterium]